MQIKRIPLSKKLNQWHLGIKKSKLLKQAKLSLAISFLRNYGAFWIQGQHRRFNV